eukprot:8915109-Ditylum_brightwellii.AAC.1
MISTVRHHTGNNINWCSSNCNKKYKQYSKQELNAIIGKNIKEVLKKMHHKPCNQQEANTIDQFDDMSIYSDDSSSSSSDDNRRDT